MRPKCPPGKPINAIHLYRQILREASYLPPVCRSRIEPRIKTRFRRHQSDKSSSKTRLLDAERNLHYLRDANQGNIVRMRRLVMIAFGRIGWRRHELMEALRSPEQPDNDAELQESLRNAKPLAGDWLDKWDTDKLLAFGRSQSKHNLHNSPRPQLSPKALVPQPEAPPENAWGRQLSGKAVRNKVLRWWKTFANRILPPVPRGDFELLAKLASGQAGKEWDVPPRRTYVGPADTSLEKWDWEAYALQPTHVVEARRVRQAWLTSNTPEKLSPGKANAKAKSLHSKDIHKYTPRSWRRLYAEVWTMTAVMERDTEKSKAGKVHWKITWGGVPVQLETRASPALFEGVDLQGKPLKPPLEQPSPETASPQPA